MNRIMGAVCVYLLIGILWSLVYLIVNIIYPGSFIGLDATTLEHRASELLYYSFITLTTVGYGEITPIKPIARSAAYLEAIVGQVYLVVMLAGLVGAFIARGQKS